MIEAAGISKLFPTSDAIRMFLSLILKLFMLRGFTEALFGFGAGLKNQ